MSILFCFVFMGLGNTMKHEFSINDLSKNKQHSGFVKKENKHIIVNIENFEIKISVDKDLIEVKENNSQQAANRFVAFIRKESI